MAAHQLDALAAELKDSGDASPYKPGYLAKTVREAAGLLQLATQQQHNLGVLVKLRDKERGAGERLQEVEELLACHTVRGRRLHRRAQRAEGELVRLRRRWRGTNEQMTASAAAAREREATQERELATVRQERDLEWRRGRELEATVGRLERELAEARLGRFR